MRQPGIRKALALAAVIGGVSALTAACGQVKAGSAASGGSIAPAACAQPTIKVSATRPLTLTDADNHKIICITRGDGVMVYLHGTADHKWTPIHASSSDLAPRANGRLMLGLGVTGAYFVAVHPGTATISSSRTPCVPSAEPSGPTASSGPHCAESVYQVTLVIAR